MDAKVTADEWEAAWGAYVELLAKTDDVRARGRDPRCRSAGLRTPRKALDRARARIERLSPGFLARVEA